MKKTFHALLVTSSLFAGSLAAFAAPSGFELDIKELRSTSSGPAQPRRQEPRKPAKSASPAAYKESSTYTVKSGDHLFLILMRQYGLSNNAAERLIPEVMSINNIRTPYALEKGRRLTIPLPARTERMAGSTGRAEKDAPATVTPPTVSTPRVAESMPKVVEIVAAPSCSLGEEFVRKLNLLVPSRGIIQGFPNFTAHHAGLTVAVACGLSPEERYTYEQLLARHGVQLLAFADDEPHRRVLEKISNQLNLNYQLDEVAGRNKLPLNILFSSLEPGNRVMKLTVQAGNR